LALEPDEDSGTAQLSSLEIGLKETELHPPDTVAVVIRCHECVAKSRHSV